MLAAALHSIALMALLAAYSPDTVRARVTAVIGESAPRTPFLLGEISGVALDRAGRAYVTDFQEPRVVVFAPDGRYLATIGRQGSGPGEFKAPTGPAFGADGALYVRNMSTFARFTVDPKNGLATRFDRFFDGPTFAPWQSKLSSLVDTQGRFYFPLVVGSRGGPTHYAYQRYGPNGRRLDSIAVPQQPTARASWAAVMVEPRSGRIVPGVNIVPFHPVPVWALTNEGTIVVGPADRYEFREVDALGNPVRRFARALAADRIPAPERAESTLALRRRIDSLPVPLEKVEGASEEVRAMRLPTTYPLSRGLAIAAEGDLWVRRWSPPPQRRLSLFDVFAASGQYRHTVVVPVDCATSPTPAIRGNSLACVTVDPETGAESVILATTGT